MEEKLLNAKTAIVAIFSTLAALLGWRGIMAVVWVITMLLDYVSGTAAACKNGEWKSAKAREGIWHKAGCIIAVMLAAIADVVFAILIGELPELGIDWPNLLLPLVLAWYIITEAGSILENVALMGASVPEWLTKMMAITKKAVDNAADKGGG